MRRSRCRTLVALAPVLVAVLLGACGRAGEGRPAATSQPTDPDRFRAAGRWISTTNPTRGAGHHAGGDHHHGRQEGRRRRAGRAEAAVRDRAGGQRRPRHPTGQAGPGPDAHQLVQRAGRPGLDGGLED